MSGRAKAGLVALGALLVLSTLVAGLVTKAYPDDPFSGKAFTADGWLETWRCDGMSSSECRLHRSECQRGAMTQSLIDNHLGTGARRSDIETLLGPPSFFGQVVENGRLYGECAQYPLGYCSGLRIDLDTLYICYDPENLVQTAGHMQH